VWTAGRVDVREAIIGARRVTDHTPVDPDTVVTEKPSWDATEIRARTMCMEGKSVLLVGLGKVNPHKQCSRLTGGVGKSVLTGDVIDTLRSQRKVTTISLVNSKDCSQRVAYLA
jgi:hypothetical protein